jgi:large subunit ribosomal protein L35
MPKMKRNSGAKKKFKVTATGKLLRRRAGQSHNLEHKSPKLKREFNKDQPVAEANDRVVRRMLGIPGARKKKVQAS